MMKHLLERQLCAECISFRFDLEWFESLIAHRNVQLLS